MATLVFSLGPMSRASIGIAFTALALLCAEGVAQDDAKVTTDKKLPSFKLTLPTTIDVPVESGPPIAANAPVMKKEDFFGAGSELKIITLSDALQMALRNNLDAKVEEVGVLIEDARLRNAYGAYDPEFSFSATRSWTQTPDDRNNIT